MDGAFRWLAGMKQVRRPVPAWLVLVLAALLLVADFLLWLPLARSLLQPPALGILRAETVRLGALYGAVFLPLLLAAWFFIAWEGRGPRQPALPPGLAPVGGGLIAIIAMALVLIASLGAGTLQPEGLQPPFTFALFVNVLVVAAIFLLQAAGEELLFRGWIQPALMFGWGAWPGLAATALLFALAHAVTGAASPVTYVNMFLGGLVFGLLAVRTGGLGAPVAMHALWNWMEQAVFGLTPNPGADPSGTLMDFRLVGPGWLGGGSDGLNGAVSLSLVLALLALLLAWLPTFTTPAPAPRRPYRARHGSR